MTEEMLNTDRIEVSPEIREQAKVYMTRRFRHIHKPDALMKKLARLGLEHVAKDMAARPEKYEAERSAEAPVEIGEEKVDPLDFLRKDQQLPSLPQVFMELQQAINAPNTGADDLASIISQDPGLTAFLLRMVNSAFYSLPMQIDTISRAVTVIGVKQLSTMAIGTSVMNLFKDIPPEVVDMERFWMHSITCGLVARRLCIMTGRGQPERAFVAGLLHDIGQLLFFKTMPEKAAVLLAEARRRGELLSKTEVDVLGFDHATLGGMLLRKWNFPYVLVAGVLEHHNPKKSQKEAEPALVHCAETITTGLGIGSSGEYYVQPPYPEVWAALGLTPGELEDMIHSLEDELEDSFSILIPEPR
jgi:putative nucleotidyltransferase with HDIG domain